MNTIKELVEHKHPLYNRYFDYWNFLLDSFEGGVDYTQSLVRQNIFSGFFDSLFRIFADGEEIRAVNESNLFQHPKERNKDYNDRVRMSYYYNFCAPILEIYTDHLFKQKVNEDFGSIDQFVQERSENIDKRNSSIIEFRKEMAECAQLYGHIFVVCDMPLNTNQILTYQDVLDNDLFPYFSTYAPQNVINWALDRYGKPYWVLLAESEDTGTDPFNVDKDKLTRIQYRLWTRQEWILYDSEFKELARNVHGLGMVPIVCVFDKASRKAKNFLGISSIADIAFIARDIYNSCSELKQILRDQTFAFLALQGESSEYNEVTVGTSKGLVYPEGRNLPAYISPDKGNAEVYFSHIDRQVKKIFQLAKLEGGSASFEGQEAVEQSGVSKAWDFNQTNSALAKKASNLEDGEMKLWQIFALWQGREFDGSLQYPNEFSIQSLRADLDEAEKIACVQLGKTFNIEVKKAIVQKKFPRIPEDKLQKIFQEIEANEGKGESGRLLDRIPSLAERLAAGKTNANSGGK